MIEVISAGLYSTIQDLGRFGYRDVGVPVSGVMDNYAAIFANRLLGNPKDAPVLEITHTGPVLQFMTETEIAVTGAGFSPAVDNMEIQLNRRFYIRKDSRLKFGIPTVGVRAYLAVKGGFESEKILGSCSHYDSNPEEAAIQKGDILGILTPGVTQSKSTASVRFSRSYLRDNILEVYPGPEFELIHPKTQSALINTPLTILSQSNRMAYILDGWKEFSADEIITAPVQPGTVQLTPGGHCVVLMRDAQTTGGYARVLQLTNRSINILAQKRTNEKIKFKLVKGA